MRLGSSDERVGIVKWPRPAAKSGRHTAMRRVTAAVVAGLAVFTAISASAATGRADVQCTGQDEPNPSAPEAYQGQYNSTVAKPLTQGVKAFNVAAASGDAQRIAQAAGQLYNEISTAPMMFGTQSPFGCYDPAVLAGLQQTTNTFAATLDGISHAAAGLNGKKPTDVPGLVVQAKPQETAYINALNAYGAQFGGKQVSTS